MGKNTTSLLKADLHVHSPCSEVRGGFLRKIIQSESYTFPDEIYRIAKKRGMNLVTITDHNSIRGVLDIAHLSGVFISEEVTAKFPEDECLIHVVVLNINEAQHREIQYLKDNLYELIQYLNSRNIVHFVAHPLSSVNGKLTQEHWEKTLLLFDIFEVRNGIQKEKDNIVLEEIITSLSPHRIEDLANKYNLKPFSPTPWEKSMVGGSDDHGGLYIGKTYTTGEGPGIEDFLESIKKGTCKPQGKGGSYSTIGRSIYATGYRFYKNKLKKKRKKWRVLDKILNDEKKGKFLEKIFLSFSNGKRGISLFPKSFLLSFLMKRFSKKMPFLRTLKAVHKLNKNLPFYATLFPYFFGFAYQNKDKVFTRRVKQGYLEQDDPLRVAVFTDMIEIDEELCLDQEKVEVLCCNKKKKSPKNGIKLFRSVTDFPFPLHPEIDLHVPPLLETLIYCEKKEFTVLHALTPGPMGIVAVIISKILKLPVVGTYQIDFSKLLAPSENNKSFKNVIWQYIGWFYSQMDKILVSSTEHLEELREQNIPPHKIEVISSSSIDKGLFKLPPSTEILNNALGSTLCEQFWQVYRELHHSSQVVG